MFDVVSVSITCQIATDDDSFGYNRIGNYRAAQPDRLIPAGKTGSKNYVTCLPRAAKSKIKRPRLYGQPRHPAKHLSVRKTMLDDGHVHAVEFRRNIACRAALDERPTDLNNFMIVDYMAIGHYDEIRYRHQRVKFVVEKEPGSSARGSFDVYGQGGY